MSGGEPEPFLFRLLDFCFLCDSVIGVELSVEEEVIIIFMYEEIPAHQLMIRVRLCWLPSNSVLLLGGKLCEY